MVPVTGAPLRSGGIDLQVHTARGLQLPGCVLTIGALDGLHRGHQTLIHIAWKRAKVLGVPLVVYTFDPPPKVFFQKSQMLTTINQKLRMLELMGADHVIVAPFNHNYLSQEILQFINELKNLNPLEIFEGNDFRFGKNREGDIDTLRQYFKVSVIEPILCQSGNIISSTRIRALLSQGRLHEASQLLGWSDIENINIRAIS